ncbi:MAG TPA: TerB family tellurite resistance protein, partial [Thermoanaerobaculia bacterium]|nr:TerB family tellurite resistance protein [Thermoanaerobaculia bacterium]
AYLLGRVAFADREISAAETARMEELVREVGKVPGEQAVLVVEIAKAQNRLFGHVENFQVSRELRELADEPQRRRLLDCLFAVSAAEGGISAEEESQVRQIASELGFTHADYVTARAAWSQHRTVLRGLPGGRS